MKVIGHDIDVGKGGVMIIKIKYATPIPSLPIQHNDLDTLASIGRIRHLLT